MKHKKVLLSGAAIAAVIAVLLFWGLAGRKGDADIAVPDASEWFLTYNNDSYSSLGRLYSDNGYLHFLDASTGEERLICNDAACIHKREGCSAYFSGITQGIVEEDRLLLLTNYGYQDGMFELYLYEAALDGSRRRQIAKLSDNIQFIMGVSVTDEYIAVAYTNSQDEEGQTAALPTAGILLYDRNNNTSRELVQIIMWNAIVSHPKIIGDRVYYEYMGYEVEKEDAITHAEDRDYFEEYLELGLMWCSMEGETGGIAEVDDFNPLVVYEGRILYTADGQLYSYHLETGETRALGKKMRVLPGDGRGGIYLVDYVPQEEQCYHLYRYDGELRFVGKQTREWVLHAVFENVVYALHYDGEINSGTMTAMPPEEFGLKMP